jgi:hypothetical protein
MRRGGGNPTLLVMLASQVLQMRRRPPITLALIALQVWLHYADTPLLFHFSSLREASGA